MTTLKHRILAWSLSILLIALPLNTILVQIFVVNLGLPVWFALWKELIAGFVMLVCAWEIYDSEKLKVKSEKGIYSTRIKTFLPIILIGLMTLIGILASIGKVNLSYIVYGFRFEMFWVWFWVILAVWGKSESEKLKVKSEKGIHPTSYGGTPQEGNSRSLAQDQKLSYLKPKLCRPEQREGSVTALLIGFVFSSVFSIITIIFGAQNTLGWLGYGQKATQSGAELLFTQPVGHLIDAGGWNSDFRLSGGFSSPNHYAAYLILLLPLFLFKVFYEREGKHPFSFADTPQEGNFINYALNSKWFWVGCLVLDLIFLVLTYARFSYLALFVMFGVLIVVWVYFKTKSKKLKVKNWLKNTILSLIFAVPLLISVVILNLPISALQSNFPSFLAKPSSTEWHQQHTSAAWRALTLQTHPEVLNQTKLSDSDILKLNNLIERSKNPTAITYRLLAGYGMGTTDPASKYLPIETNPIANLGFGLGDELYFPRDVDRPLALTPENWFLGLWVKGGIFYMLLFLAILIYFMRDIRLLFSTNLNTLQDPQNMLKLLISLSIFGLTIGAFLLDIFDSQSLALLIGPIYLVYVQQISYYGK